MTTHIAEKGDRMKINSFEKIADLTVGYELHSFDELQKWILDKKEKQHVAVISLLDKSIKHLQL